MAPHKPWLSLAISLFFTGPVLALAPPPSWSALEKIVLPSEQPPLTIDWSRRKGDRATALDPSTPTLFRERHGWCHFSTRVWLALEVKGVHYHTHLVQSRGDTFDGAEADDVSHNRPEFLQDLTLPQLLLPGSDELRGADTEEDLLNLLHLIDETFHKEDDDNQLFPSEGVLETARAFQDCLPLARQSRRAAWLFCSEEGYRLDALPRETFDGVLDRAEEWLAKSEGPFFCGPSLTAADICWTPLLERYAAQLPCLHRGLDPRSSENRWPRLQRWYQAMDTIPAYVGRIKGDATSWRKVLYTDPWWPRADLWHSRDTVGPKGELQATEEECIEEFFGGGPQDDVWSRYAAARPYVARQSPAHEAARILILNRRAISKDSSEWLDEEEYDTPSEDYLDATLRCIVSLLIEETQLEDTGDSVATLLTYLDARMCVPRDMGNLPANCIRKLYKQATMMALQND